MLLWPGADNGRTDRQHVLVPGDTLLLYTDGLVEHRTYGMDTGRAAAMVSAAPPGQPLPELLGQLLNATGSDTADDIAVLAVRIPPGRRA